MYIRECWNIELLKFRNVLISNSLPQCDMTHILVVKQATLPIETYFFWFEKREEIWKKCILYFLFLIMSWVGGWYDRFLREKSIFMRGTFDVSAIVIKASSESIPSGNSLLNIIHKWLQHSFQQLLIGDEWYRVTISFFTGLKKVHLALPQLGISNGYH